MFVLSRGKAGGIAVAFNIVLDFDFTPILTFPHRGGRDNMAHINMCQQKQAGDVRLGRVDIFCHFEGRAESEVCEWCIRSDFRFFTPLRYVQNDRIDILLRGEGRVVWAGGAGAGRNWVRGGVTVGRCGRWLRARAIQQDRTGIG